MAAERRGEGEEREEMPPPMCASTLTRMSRPHGFGLQRIAIDIFPSSGGVADFSSGEYNREVWR